MAINRILTVLTTTMFSNTEIIIVFKELHLAKRPRVVQVELRIRLSDAGSRLQPARGNKSFIKGVSVLLD